MADELHPDLAGAGDDVHDPRRQVGLAHDVGEQVGGQRRRARRLEDDGVARRQGRGDLPGQHQQREVPRDDLGDHAERARVAVREGVLELVGPAGVVEEVRRGQRHVDVAALLDRLAGVHALDDGELARALLEDARDAVEVLRPLAARQLRPARPMRLVGRGDRAADVRLRGVSDLRQRLLGRRVDDGERLARLRRAELVADEEAVLGLDPDVIGRLRRGSVLPRVLARREAPRGRRGPRLGLLGERHAARLSHVPARERAPALNRVASALGRGSDRHVRPGTAFSEPRPASSACARRVRERDARVPALARLHASRARTLLGATARCRRSGVAELLSYAAIRETRCTTDSAEPSHAPFASSRSDAVEVEALDRDPSRRRTAAGTTRRSRRTACTVPSASTKSAPVTRDEVVGRPVRQGLGDAHARAVAGSAVGDDEGPVLVGRRPMASSRQAKHRRRGAGARSG